jgi:pimeloyl-ACP methyl ester carboxylesterase
MAQHPSLGQVLRHRAAPVTVTPKPIDGTEQAWDQGVRLTRLSGQTTIQAGQLIYEDWIMDDSGAARTCTVQRRDELQPAANALKAIGFDKWQDTDSAAGEELIPDADAVGITSQPPFDCIVKGTERYGAAGYPPEVSSGAADLVEFRVAADKANVYFFIRLNAMTASDQPVVAVALDTDLNLATGSGDWGFGSLVMTRGADHVVTLTRSHVFLDGRPAAGANVAANDGGFGGFIQASVPRAAIAATSTWRMWAGTGIWDAAHEQWRSPVSPEPGPRVMNLAFRGGREPLRTWMEENQAFDLRRGWDGKVTHLSDRFSSVVNLNQLAAGANESWSLRPGYYDRIFISSVTDGGRRGGSPPANVEAEGISARQMYGLYIPTSYRDSRASPLTMWLHWRGPGDMQAVYYVPNMVRELGEQRGNIIVSPRGRGSSGWYVGDSQMDALDALQDAEQSFAVDTGRVDVAGYSMGGWGAYLLAMQYPDRFAGALAVVGPPAIGAWAYPLPPTAPQNGRPLYWTNPMVGNARYVPFAIYQGTDDELVPVSGTTAQAQTFQQNHQPYRYFLFPGYEHFSFAAVDEWLAARNYLGNRVRVTNPARVTYTRVPCLDPIQWSPVYRQEANSAYWVGGIEVRQGPSTSTCTNEGASLAAVNTRGTVDITSEALARFTDAGGPVAGGGALTDQTTPYLMTGYEPKNGAALPRANQLDVTLGNIAMLTVAGTRAGLSDCTPLVVAVTSDGGAQMALTGLSRLAGGTVTVDGKSAGSFTGTLNIAGGSHRIVITPSTGCRGVA